MHSSFLFFNAFITYIFHPRQYGRCYYVDYLHVTETYFVVLCIVLVASSTKNGIMLVAALVYSAQSYLLSSKIYFKIFKTNFAWSIISLLPSIAQFNSTIYSVWSYPGRNTMPVTCFQLSISRSFDANVLSKNSYHHLQ